MRNLPVGQFYHINVDNDMPYNVYGGLQDNGSWKAPAYVWHGDGIRNEDWQEISFGDGFDVVPMPGDPDMCYAMSQGGNVYRIHIPTGGHDLHPAEPPGQYRAALQLECGHCRRTLSTRTDSTSGASSCTTAPTAASLGPFCRPI